MVKGGELARIDRVGGYCGTQGALIGAAGFGCVRERSGADGGCDWLVPDPTAPRFVDPSVVTRFVGMPRDALRAWCYRLWSWMGRRVWLFGVVLVGPRLEGGGRIVRLAYGSWPSPVSCRLTTGGRASDRLSECRGGSGLLGGGTSGRGRPSRADDVSRGRRAPRGQLAGRERP